MLSNLQSAVNAIATEKNLDPAIIFDAIESALAAAYKREYGSRDMEVRVKFDPGSEQSTVYRVWEVVETAKDVENEEAQMPLSQAKKLKKTIKVGEEITEDVTPMDYGRIAAQSAKQVIIQKLRGAENEMIADFYKDKVGEVIPATVKRVMDNGDIEVEVERTLAILFRSKLIPGERVRTGSRIKVYVEDIKESPRGPQVILSRIHPNLVERLLWLEIPEVEEGKVEIKAIAREPGVRTKVAVASNDEGIDPVGSCVGQKGVRIQSIMDEINNEYVDMIEWTDDREEMLIRSLAPAKITGIRIDDGENPPRARVYLEEDQRSLAIGKAGQNVRLAGILTGMEIDVLDMPDWEKVLEKESGNKKKKASKAKKEEAAEEKTEEVKDEKVKEEEDKSEKAPEPELDDGSQIADDGAEEKSVEQPKEKSKEKKDEVEEEIAPDKKEKKTKKIKEDKKPDSVEKTAPDEKEPPQAAGGDEEDEPIAEDETPNKEENPDDEEDALEKRDDRGDDPKTYGGDLFK